MNPTILSEQEAYEIGIEAYHYFYSIVSMDVTRRLMTSCPPDAKPGMGPANGFYHMRAFPTADFRDVVRPNFDTLYSSAWLDLSQEPMIVSAPDTHGRYYLLPMLDMWTDVFAVPGKRTSGTGAAHFAIAPRGWHGKLPADVQYIESPTPYVWIIGRTQTNGPKDYEAVHQVQNGYQITPLSQWRSTSEPASETLREKIKDQVEQRIESLLHKGETVEITEANIPTLDTKISPLDQVNKMSAAKYFGYGAELIKVNLPHITDWSTIARFSRIGLVLGKSFNVNQVAPAVKAGLERAAVDGLKLMYEKLPTLARVVNGWQMNTDTMGVYGNFYLKRAIVALVGLGANQPEDAIYPLNVCDADGHPLDSANNYVFHFSQEELPPVDAFWSVTMYDADGFQVANSLNRFAIGDRDDLKYNPDGSLDLYIQHDSPGDDKESNWLPAPAQGKLGVTMRLYAPKAQAIDGRWVPPAVKRV